MAGDSSMAGLFKDKKMQVGAAVVGGVGLLMLVMRKGGASSTPQTMIQPAAGLDSTPTDLYNALQSLGQGWQNDLRGFTKELTNVNDKLSKLPTGGTGNPVPPTSPWHPYPIETAPAPTHTTNVTEGTLLQWFLSPTFTRDAFNKLNPHASIAGSNANGYTRDGSGNPTLSANQWITLPGSA